MLFWSFILAFVVGILYYVSLPYNPVQIERKPVADTAVAMFVNAHQRAKEMIYTIKDAGSRNEIPKEEGGGYETVENVRAPTIRMLYDNWMREVIKEKRGDTVDKGIFNGIMIDSLGRDIKLGVMMNDNRNASLTVLSSENTKKDLNNIISVIARIGTVKYQRVATDSAGVESTDQKTNDTALLDCIEYDDTITGNTGCQCDYKKRCADGSECSDDSHCVGISYTDKDGIVYSKDGTNVGYDETCVYRSWCRLDGIRMDNGGQTILDSANNIKQTCSCTETDYVITFMNPDYASWAANPAITHQEFWRSGILRRTKGSHECGVLYPKDGMTREDGPLVVPPVARKYGKNGPVDYVLDNSQRFTVSIPKLITDEIERLMSDDDLTDYLFCITPVDDIRSELTGGKNKDKGGVFHRKGYTIEED